MVRVVGFNIKGLSPSRGAAEPKRTHKSELDAAMKKAQAEKKVAETEKKAQAQADKKKALVGFCPHQDYTGSDRLLKIHTVKLKDYSE